METKICKSCNVEMPLNQYYKHKDYKNGLMSSCKSCCNKACCERQKIRALAKKIAKQDIKLYFKLMQP